MTRIPPPPKADPNDARWRVDLHTPPRQHGGGHIAKWIAYFSASVIADLLDEWVGPDQWKDEYHRDDKGRLWCHLSIWSPGLKVWVTKCDLGTSPQIEGEKGEVSDAFKRAACLKWGVGREIYQVPVSWAPCNTSTRNGKVNAYANKETTGVLVAKLVELGWEATAVAFEDSPPPEGTSPQPEAKGDPKKKPPPPKERPNPAPTTDPEMKLEDTPSWTRRRKRLFDAFDEAFDLDQETRDIIKPALTKIVAGEDIPWGEMTVTTGTTLHKVMVAIKKDELHFEKAGNGRWYLRDTEGTVWKPEEQQ